MAQDVSAYQQSGPLGSSFIIDVTARPGRTLTEIQTAVDEELAKLRQAPPSDREMQRALNQIEASFYRGMQRVGGFGGKADKLNSYFVAGGGPDYFAEDLGRYTSLSAADVRAAITQWLPSDRRIELAVEPETKK
jgi:zinc protease